MHHDLPSAPVDAVGGRLTTTLPATGAPEHCGAPMVRRMLDVADVHGRPNQAVAQAAVDGRVVLACGCGFLLEQPADGDGPSLIADDVRPGQFAGFFGRRVLVAAGRVEAAEWDLDRLLDAEGPTAPAGENAALAAVARRAADLEAAWWQLDQANQSLEDELVLAVRHHLSVSTVAVEAGMEEGDVRAMLHHAGWSDRVDDGAADDDAGTAPLASPEETAMAAAAVLTAVFDAGRSADAAAAVRPAGLGAAPVNRQTGRTDDRREQRTVHLAAAS